MRQHLVNSCGNVKMICAACGLTCRRHVKGSHDCVPALKNLISIQKQKIAALEETKDDARGQSALNNKLIEEKDALIAKLKAQLKDKDAQLKEQ